jgi:hypothetical protein
MRRSFCVCRKGGAGFANDYTILPPRFPFSSSSFLDTNIHLALKALFPISELYSSRLVRLHTTFAFLEPI